MESKQAAICSNPKCKWSIQYGPNELHDKHCPLCGSLNIFECPDCGVMVRRRGLHCTSCGNPLKAQPEPKTPE